MRKITLVTGFVISGLLSAMSMSAQAGGSVSVGVEYNSGGTVAPGGSPVVIHQYPNGRVVVQQVPVTHVYPRGESLIYQNGGQRVYSQGYGGPGTCYVDCWQNGVRPGGQAAGGVSISVGVGITKTW
jgi:hypothetical protein